ncbi:MAG TPA: hypothetical protein VKT12_04635, partial [Candidatus Binataceae bacterium]|nr:hypothetical protein [Candidatus Binataceae bacterium]
TSAPLGKPGRKRNPFNFDPPNQKFREPSIFRDFVAAYPDQSATFLKVYRLVPEIDLSLIGETETAIHTTHLRDEAAESYLADRFGQGKYWVLFNDGNRPRGQQQIAQTWITLNDPTIKPAVYDLNTLKLTSKENADEIQRLLAAGKLERDERGNLHVVRAGDRAPAPLPAQPSPASVVLSTAPQQAPLDRLGEQVIVKLLDRAIPSATSSDQLADAFKIAERLMPAAPAENPAIAEIKRELAAIGEKLNGGSNLDRDLAAYERMEAFFTKIGAGRAGSSVGSDEPVWMKPLVTLADRLGTLLMMRMGGPAPHAAPHQAAPAPQPGIHQPAAVPAPPAASYPQFLPAEAPLMDRAIQVVSLAMLKFNEGVSGFNFAAWLVGFYPGGREVFKTLEAAGGPVECIGLIAMFPQLQDITRPVLDDPAKREQLEAWLGDFLDYNADAAESSETGSSAVAA